MKQYEKACVPGAPPKTSSLTAAEAEDLLAGADLCIEEHVLADGQAQPVLGSLEGKSEQPGVVGEVPLLSQLEGNLLLGVQGKLGVAARSHPQLALIVHLLHQQIMLGFDTLHYIIDFVANLIVVMACIHLGARYTPLLLEYD